MLKITLPDGSVREFDSAVTVLDVAKNISPSLAKATLAGVVNDKLVDVVLNGDIEVDAFLFVFGVFTLLAIFVDAGVFVETVAFVVVDSLLSFLIILFNSALVIFATFLFADFWFVADLLDIFIK